MNVGGGADLHSRKRACGDVVDCGGGGSGDDDDDSGQCRVVSPGSAAAPRSPSPHPRTTRELIRIRHRAPPRSAVAAAAPRRRITVVCVCVCVCACVFVPGRRPSLYRVRAARVSARRVSSAVPSVQCPPHKIRTVRNSATSTLPSIPVSPLYDDDLHRRLASGKCLTAMIPIRRR